MLVLSWRTDPVAFSVTLYSLAETYGNAVIGTQVGSIGRNDVPSDVTTVGGF